MLALNLIVCATRSNGIGQAGRLPWRLKEDMSFFKHVTSLAPVGRKNVVIMGRKTWESIPAKFRPLAARINIVVSRQTDPASLGIDPSSDSYLVKSINSACQLIEELDKRDPKGKINKVFVIGGAEIYRTVLEPSLRRDKTDDETPKPFKAAKILMTRILSDHIEIDNAVDTFFPDFKADPRWSKSQDLQDHNDFLTLPHRGDDQAGSNQPELALPQFKFDQLVIDNQFIYKFELWTHES